MLLQAPHLPVSARCFAGIRFGFPQDGQFRVMAMERSYIEFLRSQYLASRLIAATVDDLPTLATSMRLASVAARAGNWSMAKRHRRIHLRFTN